MTKIGFVGLGHMGLPMAINLLKAGHEVTGFDVQPEPLTQFEKAGGRVADSLQSVVLQNTILITMLQTGQQVLEVYLGANGILAQPSKVTLVMDCSTIDVQSARVLHQEAQKRQILSVDAPVSGGVAGANAAKLTFMVGGAKPAFDKALPLLSLMGQNIIHTGEAGSGQAAKICNNMILGISMIAISEAFILAERLGLEAKKLFEVVNHASGQCWALSQYVPVPGILDNVPANRDYAPGFTTAMMLKDLNLSQTVAQSAGVNTVLGEQATAIYQSFYDEGHGALDFSAIIKATSI